MMENAVFAKRLVVLRMNKGISARDMSLFIRQSLGYINNIENGVHYPSVAVFFYIYDHLDIFPNFRKAKLPLFASFLGKEGQFFVRLGPH